MVHESSPSDMWYHDTLVAFSILEIDVHNLRKDRLDEAGPIIIHEINWENGKRVEKAVDHNPDRKTGLERVLQSVGETEGRVKAKLTESRIAYQVLRIVRIDNIGRIRQTGRLVSAGGGRTEQNCPQISHIPWVEITNRR